MTTLRYWPSCRCLIPRCIPLAREELWHSLAFHTRTSVNKRALCKARTSTVSVLRVLYLGVEYEYSYSRSRSYEDTTVQSASLSLYLVVQVRTIVHCCCLMTVSTRLNSELFCSTEHGRSHTTMKRKGVRCFRCTSARVE